MKPLLPVWLAAVVLWLPRSAANAGSVLLASYDQTFGYSVAPVSDPHVSFSLAVFSSDLQSGAALAPPGSWVDGDAGSVDMRHGTVPMFDRFASLATDGMNGRYSSGAGFFNAIGRAETGPESELFGVSPDLVGYDLELIRLIVHSIDTAPFQVEGLDGFTLNYDITYEFYGTPVPEPATVVLLVTGLVPALAGRVRTYRPRDSIPVAATQSRSVRKRLSPVTTPDIWPVSDPRERGAARPPTMLKLPLGF